MFTDMTEKEYFEKTLELFNEAILLKIPDQFLKDDKCLIPINTDFSFMLNNELEETSNSNVNTKNETQIDAKLPNNLPIAPDSEFPHNYLESQIDSDNDSPDDTESQFDSDNETNIDSEFEERDSETQDSETQDLESQDNSQTEDSKNYIIREIVY